MIDSDGVSPARRSECGFTLLELSIVIVIIAAVTGMAISSGIGVIASASLSATQQKMKTIEDALMKYRTVNDRLPCPGDLTLAPGSADYGLDAGADASSAIAIGTGVCTGTGMLPQANFTGVGATNTFATAAEGALPAITLGLSRDFMVDGWGNKFRYAVDIGMTAAGAFSAMPIAANCSPITVNDVNGNARTARALYALISHSANGHGAYTKNGVTVNAGSVNSNELTNCHCNSSGSAAAYAPAYVQMSPSQDPTNKLNNFDDLVTYKERWQMVVPWDAPPTPPSMSSAAGSIQAIVSSAIWYNCCYYYAPGGTVAGLEALTYSPSSNNFTYLYPVPGTISPQMNQGNGVLTFSWSWDDRYVAVEQWGANFVAIYKRNGNSLTQVVANLPGIANTDAIGPQIYWSHDGTLIEVAGSSIASTNSYNGPYLASVNEATDTFTQIMSLPVANTWPYSGGVIGGPFTLDDKYIVGGWQTPSGCCGYGWYQRTGPTSFAIIANSSSLFPTDPGVGVSTGSFSNDGQYYAIPMGNQSQVAILKNSGNDQYKPLTNVTLSPSSGSYGGFINWSPDGNWIAYNSGYPNFYMYIIRRCGNSFFQSGSGPLATGIGNAFGSWSADSKFFAIGWGSLSLYSVGPSGLTLISNPPNIIGNYNMGGGYFFTFRNTNNP